MLGSCRGLKTKTHAAPARYLTLQLDCAYKFRSSVLRLRAKSLSGSECRSSAKEVIWSIHALLAVSPDEILHERVRGLEDTSGREEPDSLYQRVHRREFGNVIQTLR
jgi:hypothetical protein